MECSRMILASVAVIFVCAEGGPPPPLCGQTPIDNPLEDRVIGGHQGAAGNWPWLVMFYARKGHLSFPCTGTIISQNHVLTAASCVTTVDGKDIDPTGIRIIGGVNQIHGENVASGPKERRNGTRIFKDGEAAILELNQPWPTFLNDAGTTPENKYFQPVCLPAKWKENIGEYGVVAGFGTNETVASQARIANVGILRENIVPYRDLSICIRSGSVPNPENYICAVGNQRDVAMGDEGAPLMTNIYGQWYQVGIVTRYRKDGDLSGHVGLTLNGTLYDRIPQHCEWISKTVGGAAACLQIEPDPACDPVFNPCSSTPSP